MKKFSAIILIAAMLITAALTLTSCSGSSDVPDGMQLVAGGESLGYYFYAPEEWVISNVGEIKSAYASRVDTSSVSFVEVYPVDFLPDGSSAEEYFFGSYFNASLAEFPTKPVVTNPDGETVIFGKDNEAADKAKRYTFTYEYFDYTANETFKFGFMQIFIKKDDRYYIFTYSASLENRSGTDTSYYSYYSTDTDDEDSKLTQIIKEFRFVAKTEDKPTEEFKRDSDGYILISDSALSGFDLYVPDSFSPDYSSAIVSATASDGSNINLTGAAGTNENVNTYMLRRFGELESTVSNIEYELMFDENGEPVYDPNGKQAVKYTSIKFGNADAANAYEYSFTYNGEKYRVYQVIIVEGWTLSYKGYVFTYTAKDSNYSAHYDEIIKIIEKVDFK